MDVDRLIAPSIGDVGADHAGAFADAGEGDGLFAEFEGCAGGFADEVGGEDGVGELGGVVGGAAEVLAGFDDAALEFFHRQGVADDAGGGGEDLFGRAIGDGGGELAHAEGVAIALGAGAGVGVAGVDDDGADFSGLDVLAAELDGGGEDFVGGECGGGGGEGVADEQGDVGLGFGTNAGVNGGGAEAGGGEKVRLGHGVGENIDGRSGGKGKPE